MYSILCAAEQKSLLYKFKALLKICYLRIVVIEVCPLKVVNSKKRLHANKT